MRPPSIRLPDGDVMRPDGILLFEFRRGGRRFRRSCRLPTARSIGRRIPSSSETKGETIERTLFPNHEKISLLSSLGPCAQLEAARDAEVVDRLSTCSSDLLRCRICLSSAHESKNSRLIKPCLCSGSIGRVHLHCLLRWIDLNERKLSRVEPQCELCGFRFKRRGVFAVSRRNNRYIADRVVLDEDIWTVLAACGLLMVAFVLAVVTQYHASNSWFHLGRPAVHDEPQLEHPRVRRLAGRGVREAGRDEDR
ncbi:RING-CH-type domain-containing protein [Aphelenchoides fujianensis]|nr:RING-CH-type domain-containing protein [Aphelenchoides fujianensis]